MLHFDQDVYTENAVTEIINLEKNLQNLDYVDAVYSYCSADYLNANNNSLNVERIASKPPSSPYEKSELIKRIKSFPILKNTFISKDNKSQLLLLRLKPLLEIEQRRDEIVREIRVIVSEKYSQYELGGLAVLNEALNFTIAKETSFFLTISLFAVIILLIIYIRRYRYIYISIVCILFPIVYLLSFIVLSGGKLTMMSMILPPFMIVYGLSDIIHITNIYIYYSELEPHAEKKYLIIKALKYSFKPCIITSITTMVGFISVALSPMKIIQQTGMYAFIGVGFSFIIIYLVAICGFMFLNKPSREYELGVSKIFGNINNQFLEFVIKFTSHNKLKILIISGIIFIIGLLSIPFLEINTYPIEYLSKDQKVRQDNDKIEKVFGAYLPFELIIKSKDGSKLIIPSRLLALEKFQKEIEQLQEIYNPYSAIDIIKYLNQQFLSDTNKYMIPNTSAEISQLLLLYEMNPQNKLKEIADDSYSELRLTARVKMLSSLEYQILLNKVENIFHNIVPEKMQMQIIPQGYTPLYVVLIDYITKSQLLSFLGAIILIAFSILIVFKNFKIMILCMIPNIVSISFIIIVLFKIPLDSGTAMISAIVLGVAVDATIHFFYAFNKNKLKGLDSTQSVDNSLRIVGKSFIISSIILSVGFFIIAMSSVKSLFYFGLISGLTVIFALIVDLLLFSVILRLKKH